MPRFVRIGASPVRQQLIRPVTVPPSSLFSWWNSQWMRPLCEKLMMFSRNVFRALSVSRMLLIARGTSCWWSRMKSLVKDGWPFSVVW